MAEDRNDRNRGKNRGQRPKSGGYGGRSAGGKGGGKGGSTGRGSQGAYRGKGKGKGPQTDRRPAKKKVHQGEFRSQDPNEPVIPAGVAATDLDAEAMKGLATISGANQEIVARHLVVAGQLLDIDPELAYKHTQAAVKRAGRVDVVREAAALTAYASGRFDEALREVRAVRRMRGDMSLRAIEADCERGLGRPERAVEIVEATDNSALPLDEQVELVLVAAGARADLGQSDFALMILEQAIDALPEEAPDDLHRRLGLMRGDLLNELDRKKEAEEVLAALPPVEDVMEIIDLDALLDADVDDVRTDLRGSVEPLSTRFDGALLDLDGVCFHGDTVYVGGPEALETAEDNGMHLGFVTNNASRSAAQVAEKLNGFGYSVETNQVITAAQDLMADLEPVLPAGSKVLVVGSESLKDLVKETGFEVVPDAHGQVDAVVQGFSPNVDWAILSEAAYALGNGAKYYATNLDTTLPTERGFALGNGSLVAAVSRATGKRAMSAGKPRPEIFTRTAERMHMETPLVVGDRLNTDVAGAVAAKMASLHVLTGVNSARDVVLADRGQRPSFVAIDVAGLNDSHPRPLHHRDGTWTCGLAQPVKIMRGIIEVAGIPLHEDGEAVPINLDTYRAIIAAAWHYDDDRRKAKCPPLRVLPNDDPEGIITASNQVPVPEEPAVEENQMDGEREPEAEQ